MIINRKKPSVHIFSVADKKSGTLKSLRLNPGINVLSEEQNELWNELKNDSVVEDMIDNDELDIVTENEETIKSFDQKKALQTVKDTFDVALLNKWASEDIRPKVKYAIKAQVELLTKDDSKEESDEG